MDPLTLAFFGDSLTMPLKQTLNYAGPLIDDRDMYVEFSKTLPALLQLQFPDVIENPILVISSVERGATTEGKSRQLSSLLLEYQPHFVVMTLGTSDCRLRRKGLRREGGAMWQKVNIDQFRENLTGFATAIATSRAVPITFSILPPGSEVLRKYPASAPIFENYNRMLKDFTQSVGGHFEDFSNLEFDIDTYVAPDGFHYSEAMHQYAATRVIRFIMQDIRHPKTLRVNDNFGIIKHSK